MSEVAVSKVAWSAASWAISAADERVVRKASSKALALVAWSDIAQAVPLVSEEVAWWVVGWVVGKAVQWVYDAATMLAAG